MKNSVVRTGKNKIKRIKHPKYLKFDLQEKDFKGKKFLLSIMSFQNLHRTCYYFFFINKFFI